MPQSYAERVISFDRITVSEPEITTNSIRGDITVTSGDEARKFRLIFTYSEPVNADRRTAGLILTMPVINFTFFAKELFLDFPVGENDIRLLQNFLKINAREVFVNKICRRRFEFIKKEYIPEESDINQSNSDGITQLIAPLRTDSFHHVKTDPKFSAVLSSGGKESLLTYGMLREAGSRVFSFFFNESGGHWITAKTSYDYFSGNYKDVLKVWSNVDRFYKFMQRRVKILDQVAVTKWADTYPLQLFIFPVYIFALVPFIIKYGISSIYIGDEFDDPREMPDFHGLKHYYGIFDQSLEFNRMMSEFFKDTGIGSVLTSAVYPIAGNIVEKILLQRYPELFKLQRSCHSCHYENGGIVPCGRCSKCLGILMFTIAAGGDPTKIGYEDISTEELSKRVESERMRLDSDELSYLKEIIFDSIKPGVSHVTGIHLLPDEKDPGELIPEIFRGKIMDVISSYSSGTFSLIDGEWVLSRH
ncbi:MAG: metal-binding protein [Thermoplasmatales archaeon B_DKE]|nr:MAG: metal-binding protein [Thermoplasmatales archaeon B_DKE]QRF75623.1 hypothetical protein Thermo_01129 [Thermoplasmatales archaeon]